MAYVSSEVLGELSDHSICQLDQPSSVELLAAFDPHCSEVMDLWNCGVVCFPQSYLPTQNCPSADFWLANYGLMCNSRLESVLTHIHFHSDSIRRAVIRRTGSHTNFVCYNYQQQSQIVAGDITKIQFDRGMSLTYIGVDIHINSSMFASETELFYGADDSSQSPCQMYTWLNQTSILQILLVA